MTSVVELLSDDELEGLFLTLKQKNKNAIQKIKRETDRLYPLALSQEKFWYFSQLHKNNVTYNIPVRFTIVGELNLDIFEASIKRQIVQNEVLRTKIVTSNGVPKQKIGSSDTIKIEKLDLKYDQEQIIDEYLIKLASKTFDIPGDYLFRPYIVRLVDNQYIALFVFHHIIFDGWSVSIFLKNLSNDYNSMLMNTDLQEKKSDIQFIDYASWQVEHYNKGNFNLKLEQWKQTLKDKNVKLDLPYISVPNNTQNNFFTGKKLLRQLPNKLFNTIEAAAKLCNTTPYVVSLAAYVILLYKYSQQDIINIGTPVANRINDHVKEVLGCLMNTLVLSFNVETKKTLKDIIVNTKQIVTHALENQDIPIETIIKHSNPDRESHDHPYFQTLFVFQNATNVDVNLSDCDS